MGYLGWIREYSKSLYLRKLPDDALKRRYEDLAGNLWSTDAAGNVVPIRNPQQRQQLVELIVHVLCEQRLRAGDPSLAFNEGEIRRAASAGYQPPKLTKPFVGPTSGFAKFGKQIHTRTAFEEGVLRVAPASGFNDPSLNSAQRDDELQHWDVTPNKQLLMRLYGLDDQEISVDKSEMLRGVTVPDFYVWCCGDGYDARLFHEFQRDAVLVIRNIVEFRSRLTTAMQKTLPGWTMKDGPLSYYDPYTTRREELTPIFSKKLWYQYQNEYRFAWSAPDGARAAAPLFPILGPLTDIAEYYEIERSASAPSLAPRD